MKTVDEIYAELKSSFESSAGIELKDGGDMALRFHALSVQLHDLWCRADFVSRQSSVRTATGEYLDFFAATAGLTRKPPVKAKGKIAFYRKSPTTLPITVPAGVVCKAADGREYITTSSGTIAPSVMSCVVNAEAVEPGEAGNIGVGAISEMELNPAGVWKCSNTYSFSGGRDTECDDELRARIMQVRRSGLTAANAEYYKALALEVPGVAAVSVKPRVNGRGSVGVAVCDAFYNAKAELLAEVQRKINEQREICVDCSVTAAREVDIDLDIYVHICDGFSYNDIRSAVIREISSFFSPQLIGQNVEMSAIRNRIMLLDGVSRCSISSPDAELGWNEVGVLGVYTINEA